MKILLLYFLLAMNPAREAPGVDAIKGPTCQVVCAWPGPCPPCRVSVERPRHTNEGGRGKL